MRRGVGGGSRGRASGCRGAMALSWLQRLELALFAATFLCGALAAAMLTRTQASFSGSCPLYGVATLNHSSLALSRGSAPSLCYFVAGASGLLALCCLLLLLFWVYSSCIEDSQRGPLGLRMALALSTTAIFLVLVSACVLRFGTSALCNSILSQNTTISCSEAQKIPWTPPGTALHFYSNLHNAENSSWVHLVLWCVVLVLQIMQLKSETTPFWPLERGDPEWSSATDVLVGPRLSCP
ncbi:transmembrane protein 179B isoform X1 [Sturnira hondurensis]|uniref:transmembrane protein 179B isoform X1 n=1 Tax=Sturnira hondurensis TaxID=192404 RepID=UPI0018790562|nr:transmembrane protein 179B isoform X1 [Sturnira hondurensis]